MVSVRQSVLSGVTTGFGKIQSAEFPEITDPPFVSVELLGFGGQAMVDRVGVTGTGISAARKTFIVNSGKDPEVIHGEACMELHHMMKLSPHRHITTPILAYRHNDKYHIVMTPVADSGSLASFFNKIRSGKERTPAEYWTLLHCFGCLTLTMAHIHKASIRYKDVKPENILVHEGELLFSDFGVAYDFSLSPDGRSTTEGYAGAQTWAYSAPEVHAGAARNRKSDMFSLGVVLYKVLLLLHDAHLVGIPKPGFYCHMIEEMITKVEQFRLDPILLLPPPAYDVVIAMLMRDQVARVSSTDALTKLRDHAILFCNHCYNDLGNINKINTERHLPLTESALVQ